MKLIKKEELFKSILLPATSVKKAWCLCCSKDPTEAKHQPGLSGDYCIESIIIGPILDLRDRTPAKRVKPNNLPILVVTRDNLKSISRVNSDAIL